MSAPRIRPSLAKAASELSELARIVEADDGLTDDRLSAIGRRGDALLQELCATRCLGLGDVLLKLSAWAGTPASMWNHDALIDALIWDVRAMIREDDDICAIAPKGWRRRA